MAEERIIRLMKKVPLFSKMQDADVAQISDQCIRRECRKDQVILVEEDVGQTLFIILKGTVKITRTSDEGREVIITILKSGDFFGELSLLDGKGRSATVVAMEESELLTLRRSEFLLLLERYRQSIVSPKLPVQQDLANMAGTARETISRVMAMFESRDLIERDGHRVIIRDFERFKSQYRSPS